MTLKDAKDIFEEIAELCIKLEDNRLSDALQSIYQDVEDADSISDMIVLLGDLMFYVDEISWSDQDIEEFKIEIQNLYNKFLDEAE